MKYTYIIYGLVEVANETKTKFYELKAAFGN